MKHLLCLLLLIVGSVNYIQTTAQLLPKNMKHPGVPPVRFDQLYLAGNYGELRPDHFHAGLDFKTQGSVGHPVYAFDDGYVARVGVNAYGYGLVLYVAHPCGLTSVYAHLDAFGDSIAARVLRYQLEHEANNVDITFEPGELPVSRGQCIATSGNTGSSGGPHVHFELRDTETEAFYDPMPYFLDKIKDTVAPRIRNVYLYPLGGLACGSTSMQSSSVITDKIGKRAIGRTFTAWGKVGLGLKAYDYMDGTSNIYGVKYVRLYEEDSLIYSFQENEFFYDERRFTNSLTDYRMWRTQRSMIMKSFREPGNHLRMIRLAVNDGILDINEERTYHFRYEVQDAHGNQSSLSFNIVGKPASMPPAHAVNGMMVSCESDFELDTIGCHFTMPAGRIYTDVDFTFSAKPSADPKIPCVSPIYKLGNPNVPLHDFCPLRIDVPESFVCDSVALADSSKLYVACLDGRAVSGKFVKDEGHAYMVADVRQFGQYAIRKDMKKPTVSAVGKPSYRRVAFLLADVGSGIASWRGTIDGVFVPFVMNAQAQVVANPSLQKFPRQKSHKVELVVTDHCGNETIYRGSAWF